MMKKRNWPLIGFSCMAVFWFISATYDFGAALDFWSESPRGALGSAMLSVCCGLWMLSEARWRRPAEVFAGKLAGAVDTVCKSGRVTLITATFDGETYEGAQGIAATFAFGAVAIRAAGMDRERIHEHLDRALDAVEARTAEPLAMGRA